MSAFLMLSVQPICLGKHFSQSFLSNLYEQIRLELRNKSVTAYLLHHGFIKAATERGIECDKKDLSYADHYEFHKSAYNHPFPAFQHP